MSQTSRFLPSSSSRKPFVDPALDELGLLQHTTRGFITTDTNDGLIFGGPGGSESCDPSETPQECIDRLTGTMS